MRTKRNYCAICVFIAYLAEKLLGKFVYVILSISEAYPADRREAGNPHKSLSGDHFAFGSG
jgi:hypothetical protein